MQSAVLLSRARAVHAASLALLLIVAAGCGKGPTRPLSRPGQPLGSAETRTVRMPADDDPNGNRGGIPTPPETWRGGPHSVMIGPHLTTSDVLAQADTLHTVRIAKDEFARRGYIRRAELDTAVTAPNATTVLLGYQKPGYALNQMEAFIVVVGRRFDVSASGYRSDAGQPGQLFSMIYPTTYYAIQVSGGLIAHAAGDSILFLDTPEDPAIAVTSTLIGNPPKMIGPAEIPHLTTDWWLQFLNQNWFSSWDMWYFNVSGFPIAYGLDDAATDEWNYICERCNTPEAHFALQLFIGFSGGVATAIAPALGGPIEAILIRKALINGAIGAATAALNYWNDHRP